MAGGLACETDIVAKPQVAYMEHGRRLMPDRKAGIVITFQTFAMFATRSRALMTATDLKLGVHVGCGTSTELSAAKGSQDPSAFDL